MSGLRVFVLIVLISWCKADPPTWTSPSDDTTVIEKDFKEDGACVNIVETYAAFGVDKPTIHSVPDSPGLFFIDQNLDTYMNNLQCHPDVIPDTTTTYILTLSATNSEGTADRIITIKHLGSAPANSADPQFDTNSLTTITVKRDAYEEGNTILTSFVVTDDDNDVVTLSIPDGTPFLVNGMSIIIDQSLQNIESPYTLVITATDDGDPARSTEWTLTITLRMAPVFTTPLNDEEIPMCENDYDGQELATLAATFDTLATIDTHTFSLESATTDTGSNAIALFDVIANKLNVKAGISEGTFDVDAPSSVLRYTLKLRASDGVFFSEITVVLVVEDFNDHPPVLGGTWPRTETLLETATPGDMYSVTVTDGDLTDENKDFTFFLTGSSKFSIDETGVISQTGTVAFADSPYVLNIGVTDTIDLNTLLTDTETLNVVIETEPEFVDLASQYSVTENVVIGTEVLTFTVQDVDGIPQSQIDITIVGVSDEFEIKDGKLVTKSDIDAEVQQSYTLKFSCTDGKYTTESIDVTINVNDENDNSPTMSLVARPVDEDANPGIVLVEVEVADIDVTSPNNQVTWTLDGGDGGHFGNTNTAITLITMPSSVTTNEFVVSVTATDGGTPPREYTESVTITINENVDECVPNDPCSNSALCTPHLNAFTCACTPGWKGDLCDLACDGNMFGQDCGQSCDCDSTRVIDPQCDHVTGDCKCNEFWEDPACQTDVDECTVQPTICDAVGDHRECEDTDGGYTCNCIDGYREIGGTCQEDDCILNPCDNGGTCTDTIDGFTCACTPGWKLNTNCGQACDGNMFGQDCGQSCDCDGTRITDPQCDHVTGDCKCNEFWEGPSCEIDVDECTVQPTICDAVGDHRECEDTDGGYTCNCIDGYREIEGTCQEDECSQTPCDNGGTCTDTIDGFTCACTPGWKLNTNCGQACDSNTFGQDCLEICKCNASHVTDQEQHCDHITGECKCNVFWEDPDCETDVDECTVQPTICDAVGDHRKCDNTDGGYSCNCIDGYREIEDACQEDECSQTPCDNGGTCTDTIDGFTCACTPGWKLNTNCGQACDSNTFEQDCGETCNCTASRVTDQEQQCDPVSGDCKCNAFWEGPACETDVDECTVDDPCDPNEKRVCINLEGSYICECETHYEEIDGACVKSNKEKEKIPPGLLVATIAITSTCPPGLNKKSTYEQIRKDIEKSIEDRLKVNCTAYNIKCGSLVFDIVFHTGNGFSDKVALVNDIEDFKANGSIVYDDQTAPISVTDIGFSKDGNDSTFLPVRDFCDGKVCYRCEAANTVMECKVLPEDNQELIWALGGFMLCLVVFGSIVCLLVVCYKVRKSNARQHRRKKYSPRNGHRSMTKTNRSDSDRVFSSTPWQDRYNSKDVPRIARAESYRASPYSIYNGREYNGKSSFGHPPLYS